MNTPTNRELNSDIKHIKETLCRIEAQTVKTNGRVSALEKWRSYLLGAFAMVTILFVPILVAFMTQYYNGFGIEERIQTGIKQALLEYEIEVQ